MSRIPDLARWSLPAAVAVSLGFGAMQALARPAEAAQQQVCSRRECKEYCALHGASGDCVGGMCVCRIPVE